MLPVFAALIYLTMAFMFAPVLVLDRGHAFSRAMRLSQRVVNRQLLPMLGLVLLAWLISLAGLLALASASPSRCRSSWHRTPTPTRICSARPASSSLDAYTGGMARGWESKSVEEQQDAD